MTDDSTNQWDSMLEKLRRDDSQYSVFIRQRYGEFHSEVSKGVGGRLFVSPTSNNQLQAAAVTVQCNGVYVHFLYVRDGLEAIKASDQLLLQIAELGAHHYYGYVFISLPHIDELADLHNFLDTIACAITEEQDAHKGVMPMTVYCVPKREFESLLPNTSAP